LYLCCMGEVSVQRSVIKIGSSRQEALIECTNSADASSQGATPEGQRLAMTRRAAEIKERRFILAANASTSASTSRSNQWFYIHRGARAPHTLPTQKSAMLCTQPPTRGCRTKFTKKAEQPKRSQSSKAAKNRACVMRHPHVPTLPPRRAL
jgi:hypothetical protein